MKTKYAIIITLAVLLLLTSTAFPAVSAPIEPKPEHSVTVLDNTLPDLTVKVKFQSGEEHIVNVNVNLGTVKVTEIDGEQQHSSYIEHPALPPWAGVDGYEWAWIYTLDVAPPYANMICPNAEVPTFRIFLDARSCVSWKTAISVMNSLRIGMKYALQSIGKSIGVFETISKTLCWMCEELYWEAYEAGANPDGSFIISTPLDNINLNRARLWSVWFATGYSTDEWYAT